MEYRTHMYACNSLGVRQRQSNVVSNLDYFKTLSNTAVWLHDLATDRDHGTKTGKNIYAIVNRSRFPPQNIMWNHADI